MFPAPNAETCVGSSTMIAIATSSTYCDETPMVVWRARSGWWGDVEGSKSRDDARKTWTRAVIACITGLKCQGPELNFEVTCAVVVSSKTG
jgi:hypothetical protein